MASTETIYIPLDNLLAIHLLVILIVPHRDAHRRGFAALLIQIQRIFGSIARVLKCAIAFIDDVEVVWRGVVGHQQVHFAIIASVDQLPSAPLAFSASSVNVPSWLLWYSRFLPKFDT